MGTGGETLLRPDQTHRAWASAPISHGLPRDLVWQARSRLRVMALLYAAVFFLSDIFPALVTKANRATFFGDVVRWLPGTISISVALIVAAAITDPRVSPRAAAAIAIVFEVASSYGIAAAELLQPGGSTFGTRTWIGLSWVAVWTLIFTIVVPSSPRRSVLASLAASSAVPVMAAISIAAYPPPMLPNTAQFFFVFVSPYLLVVLHGVRRSARAVGAWRRG